MADMAQHICVEEESVCSREEQISWVFSFNILWINI